MEGCSLLAFVALSGDSEQRGSTPHGGTSRPGGHCYFLASGSRLLTACPTPMSLPDYVTKHMTRREAGVTMWADHLRDKRWSEAEIFDAAHDAARVELGEMQGRRVTCRKLIVWSVEGGE